MYTRFFVFLSVCIVSFCSGTVAQKTEPSLDKYKIKYGETLNKACVECLNLFSVMPRDVQYGLFRAENTIVFSMTDIEWFNKMFNGRNDGIAVDIIDKKQFACGKNSDYSLKRQINGYLTPPVYLKKAAKDDDQRLVGRRVDIAIKVGEIPDNMKDNMDLEFNMVLIKDGAICHYMRFYDLPGIRLDLLRMDLFMDTLSAKSGSDQGKLKTVMQNKSLEFVIPFEKNKSEYKPEDVTPIRDTLNMTLYDIKEIRIRAYSSVEGSEERNLELQKKRAESIIAALQSFQKMPITEDVQASENWVDFMADISGTPYATMKILSKSEIKKELEKKEVAEKLEPILKLERKAILFIDLEKKTTYRDMSEPEAKKSFNEALKKGKLDVAMEIQQAIFQNVDTKKYSPTIIGELEVPDEAIYNSFLLNNTVYKARQEENILNALGQFQRLDGLMPGNPLVKYNICVLEIKLFQESELVVDRKKMLTDLNELEKLKVDSRLVRRLKINYNIILCDYLMGEKKYAEKDKSLNYIYINYKNINYKDEDLLRLAQFFVTYNKSDWALKLTEPRSTKLDVSIDLLFFYVNLTVSDSKYTAKESYRATLMNAYNLDGKRFCKMFNTAYIEDGGISFQLLRDAYLKKNYCENCH